MKALRFSYRPRANQLMTDDDRMTKIVSYDERKILSPVGDAVRAARLADAAGTTRAADAAS